MNSNNNNNNMENSDDELDALINGKSKLTDQEPENILTPPPLYTDTNKLPIKEALDNQASPALRLAAFIVDVIYFVLLVMLPYFILTLIAALTFLPQLFFSPTNEVDTSIFDSPIVTALTILPLLYVILQFLAFKRGTTLGHRFFKLSIISAESGELAKFWRVFLREVLAKNFIYIIIITALLLPPIYSFITPLYFLII